MDINRFTQKAQEAIGSAQTKAVRYGHQQVDVEHVLAALLEQDGGLATSIFNRTEINTESLKRRVEQELEDNTGMIELGEAEKDQAVVTEAENALRKLKAVLRKARGA